MTLTALETVDLTQPLRKQSADSIQLYSTDDLFCGRCHEMSCCRVTPDMYATGDSPTEYECNGTLADCPLNDEVQTRLREYRGNPVMTSEFLCEGMDTYIEALTEAMNNGHAATALQLLNLAREHYFAGIAICEVINK